MVPLTFKGKKVNLRWQSIPMGTGYDVILRLLDGNEENHSVLMPDKMGLEPSQLKIINSLGYVSGGVTILSGETGSAKSTLLRALSYMYMVANRGLKKQYAVNMPSEYPMPWLSEQSVPRAIDETDEMFSAKVAGIIRAWMRGDPDDLTVGEILDAVVARLVVELALTGHPVRTTLHATSIIHIFMRLLGGFLQMAPDEIASEGLINAVGNQRLIPLLCENCKGEAEARKVMSAAELNLLEEKFGLDTSKLYCRFEPGCENCRKPGLFTRFSEAGADKKRAMVAGTKGSTLAMELYQPTLEFLDRILVKDWNGAMTAWRSERVSAFDDADMTGKTIYEHALYKASQGIIDPRFISLSMKPFELYRVMPGKGA
jgi:type II secretory ATPase GspE/PulE/Tfp pilus assembly ATPase PilB-like protein